MSATAYARHRPPLLRLAQRGVVLLLCLSLGLQWALMQGVAWTGMFIGFAREGSVIEAVQKTFDGRHACSLCKTVKEGSQESSPTKDTGTVKVDDLGRMAAVLVCHAVLIPPAAEPMWFAPWNPMLVKRNETPETPPPRRALA
ncbi:hypothetical protein [Prosthecobacter sp.]|uniref:hypothetical protein n=1 Tax=Prosthecobacter sp. TaxID=1965333 RepID=UPI003783CDA1